MDKWKEVEFTPSDMLKMQQDAIARVRQMQERARQSLYNSNLPLEPVAEEISQPQQPISQPIPNEIVPQKIIESPIVKAVNPPQLSPTPPIPPPQKSEDLISNLLSNITGSDTRIGKILEVLNLDSEKLLIIGLLIVLYNEKADKNLLFSLIYLLL